MKMNKLLPVAFTALVMISLSGCCGLNAKKQVVGHVFKNDRNNNYIYFCTSKPATKTTIITDEYPENKEKFLNFIENDKKGTLEIDVEVHDGYYPAGAIGNNGYYMITPYYVDEKSNIVYEYSINIADGHIYNSAFTDAKEVEHTCTEDIKDFECGSTSYPSVYKYTMYKEDGKLKLECMRYDGKDRTTFTLADEILKK